MEEKMDWSIVIESTAKDCPYQRPTFSSKKVLVLCTAPVGYIKGCNEKGCPYKKSNYTKEPLNNVEKSKRANQPRFKK